MNAANDDIRKGQLLFDLAFLKASLHHTATMLVRANLITVGHAGIEDELSVGPKGLRSRAIALLIPV